MYDKLVLDKMNNLPYLKATKKANVTIISKKNTFGDVVKFFAQINKNDVIQKFSFKATGCTHFVVYCDYFCGLVEGKSIEESLKLGKDDLEQFGALTEPKLHVVKIILDTFALLIKKYRKGVSAGTIEAVEVEEVTQTTNKKLVKKESRNIEIEDSTVSTTKRTKQTQTSKKLEVIENNEKSTSESTEVKSDIKSAKSVKTSIKSEVNAKLDNSQTNEVESLDVKKVSKVSKKAKVEETKAEKMTHATKIKADKLEAKKSKLEAKTLAKETKAIEKENKQKEKSNKLAVKQTKVAKNKKEVKAEVVEVVEPDVVNSIAIVEPESTQVATISGVQNIQGATVRHRVEKTTRITRVETENDEVVAMEHREVTQTHSVEQNNNSVKQASNIMALKTMINSSKNSSLENSKEDKKVQHLSSMIDSIKEKNQKAVEEKEHAERISSIRNNLERLNKQTSSKKTEQQASTETDKEVIVEEPKKKKGLFGWLKKK